MVDILPEIAGIDFDHARRRRVMESIDRDSGLKVAFISANNPVAAKAAAERAQDLADVEALHRARDRTARVAKARPLRTANKPAPKA